MTKSRLVFKIKDKSLSLYFRYRILWKHLQSEGWLPTRVSADCVMFIIICSINLQSLSVAIWFKLLRIQAVAEAFFLIVNLKMSVSIGDFVLSSGNGLYMDAGDDSGDTTEKLIVNIIVDAENEADIFTRVCYFLNTNNLVWLR